MMQQIQQAYDVLYPLAPAKAYNDPAETTTSRHTYGPEWNASHHSSRNHAEDEWSGELTVVLNEKMSTDLPARANAGSGDVFLPGFKPEHSPYTKCNKKNGLYNEVCGFWYKGETEAAQHFAGYCKFCKSSKLNVHMQNVSMGACSDPYAMQHRQDVSKHGYWQLYYDRRGRTYLLDHVTLQTCRLDEMPDYKDKLRKQWVAWWSEQPDENPEHYEIGVEEEEVWERVRAIFEGYLKCSGDAAAG